MGFPSCDQLPSVIDLRLAVSEDIVGDYPIKITCREHKDKVQSLAIYPHNLHCFGCGFNIPSFRTLDALAYLLKVDVTQAIEVASKYSLATLDAYREKAATEARRDPLPFSLALIYRDVLMTRRVHRKDWLRARGLSVETIFRHYLGHDGTRFVIPVFDADENLISLRYRRDDDYCEETTPKYSGTKGRNGLYTYPDQVIARPENRAYDALVLCEGELDALRLWQEDIPAITATNGAGQTHKLPRLIRQQFPWIRRLLIATDMDDAGEEAARITADAATEQGYDGVTRIAWTGGKDVTEALQCGGLSRDAVREYTRPGPGGAGH